MKKRLGLLWLRQNDPPNDLDQHICHIAAVKAKKLMWKKRCLHWFPAITAVAAFAITGIIIFPQPINKRLTAGLSKTELLHLSDWSKLEQENYNLDLQLLGGGQAVFDLSEFKL